MTKVWLALLVALAFAGVTASGADFTASSSSPANAFAAAASFNTVAVSLTDPGTPLRGTVALAATASSDRGIDRVRFQTAPAGSGAWTDVCEDASAPYGCDWNTAGVADGVRDVRALAVDQAGYERASVIGSRRVDNTLPAASLTDPGAYLQGNENLTATASDAGSGLAALAIEHRPAAGGPWTELCTGATSPRNCSLATAAIPDGDRELRARAVDAAGNERLTTALVRRVDNTAPAVSVTSPGAVRGTISVNVDADDGAGSGADTVWIDFRVPGEGWTEVCSDGTAPYSCTGLDTTQVPDGVYEARARATDETGLTGTSPTVSVHVDNTAPGTSTLNDPGSPLEGSEVLTGTAADGASGIAAWTVQYRTAGSGGAWTDACTDTAAPFTTCTWNTAGVADALYDLRAVARDAAGNETVSAARTNRRVDNGAPAVTLADPGSPIRGTVNLTATATDPAGVQSVIFERRATGSTGGWTTICTDNAAAYTCSFNTAALNGSYDLRARSADTLGHSATAEVAARVIDNTAPAGSDVQTGNVGTAGRFTAGDWIRLTWTEQLAPASVLAGWAGAAQAITVRIDNQGNNDRIDFYNAANTTRLNLVRDALELRLNRSYVSNDKSFSATMVQSGASITITFGTVSATSLQTAGAGSIAWRPSAGATDLAGNAGSTTQVTEQGGSDVDF